VLKRGFVFVPVPSRAVLSSLLSFNFLSIMSGAGKSGGKGGRGKKAGGKSQSRSARAGLQFPVGRVSGKTAQQQQRQKGRAKTDACSFV
jgi:hypothetical protein